MTMAEVFTAPTARLAARTGPRGQITAWTPRSRSRMVRRLAELDWAPFAAPGVVPAMVALTYPGDWLPVAPTGQAVKAHLAALVRRWQRAWPGCWLVWKLEFQARGAPHVHLFAVAWPTLPAGVIRGVTQARQRPAVGDGLYFTRWIKAAWADIVAHPDPAERAKHESQGAHVDWAEGLRSVDPKRVGVYFTKHAQYAVKEYQHQVPPEWQLPGAGPGRFWGVAGLDRVAVPVVLTDTEWLLLQRTLRRHHRAQRVRRTAQPLRHVVRHGRRGRKVHRRTGRLRYGLGFITTNDAPRLALDLARLVQATRDERTPQ